jgi:hypothetical protein
VIELHQLVSPEWNELVHPLHHYPTRPDTSTVTKDECVASASYNSRPSKRDWLVAVELPNIFEEFFNRKAGRSRSAGAPSGPTVRFIAAVMNEIDPPANSETIVRAMTMYSELRKARAAVRNRAPSIGKK